MDALKIVGFGIIAVILILIVEEQRKEIAIMISIVASVFIVMFIISEITPIIDFLNNLVNKSGINLAFLKVILKVTGIAYIIEISKNICIDANQNALAKKIEIAGKVIIVGISIPIITALLNIVTEMLVLV